jgi:hypothetical protein
MEGRRPLLNKPFKVLVELFDLELNDENAGGGEWVESARWIKYEEVG